MSLPETSQPDAEGSDLVALLKVFNAFDNAELKKHCDVTTLYLRDIAMTGLAFQLGRASGDLTLPDYGLATRQFWPDHLRPFAH